MTGSTPDFSAAAFSAQPDYDEEAVRREFARAVPLRTLVVYCFDPRATGIPDAIAAEFGETFPGTVVHDDAGNKVASTATLFEVVVAGGRAVDALRSITVAQHLFSIENVVIVHHTHCGATTYTRPGIIDAWRDEHGRDISHLYEPESVCISDYVASLTHDVKLVRESAGTPAHTNIFGFVYDINDGTLTRIVEDAGITYAGQALATG